jgi:hypothetical protein
MPGEPWGGRRTSRLLREDWLGVGPDGRSGSDGHADGQRALQQATPRQGIRVAAHECGGRRKEAEHHEQWSQHCTSELSLHSEGGEFRCFNNIIEGVALVEGGARKERILL